MTISNLFFFPFFLLFQCISHGIKISDYGNYFIFIPSNLHLKNFRFKKTNMCVCVFCLIFIWMCTISSNSFHSQVSSLFIRSLIEAHIISKRLIAKGKFHLNSFVSFEPPEVHYFSNTHVMNAMLHTVCVI